jgi:predicted porin
MLATAVPWAIACAQAQAQAQAQANVTLFGLLDAGVSHYSLSGGPRMNVLSNHGQQLSRMGIRGAEDLGQGLKASFWLEAPVTLDDGTAGGLNFSRRSTISLSGRWGEVRMGRDFTPTYRNDGFFDPFNATGVGTQVIVQARASSSSRIAWAGKQGLNNPSYLRTSNNISYFLPGNEGVYGTMQYAFDEQAGGAGHPGRYVGLRLGCKDERLNVAMSAGKIHGTSPSSAATPGITTMSLAGSYAFRPLTVMAHWGRDRIDSGVATRHLHGFMLGASANVGSGEVKLAYSQARINWNESPTTRKVALGYVHKLSKRTSLYATAAHMKNSGGAQLTVASALAGRPNTSSTGMDWGIMHSF